MDNVIAEASTGGADLFIFFTRRVCQEPRGGGAGGVLGRKPGRGCC